MAELSTEMVKQGLTRIAHDGTIQFADTSPAARAWRRLMARREERTIPGSLTSLGQFSDPAVLILTSLAGGPRHGYALIKDVEEFANVTLVPGTLYGALDRLASYALIERLPAVDRRHPYQITAAGRTALREHVASIEQVTSAAISRLQPREAF